jgi:hypothetical protein
MAMRGHDELTRASGTVRARRLHRPRAQLLGGSLLAVRGDHGLPFLSPKARSSPARAGLGHSLDRVERFVGENLIAAHEASAELFLWSAGTVLVPAILAAIVKKEKTRQALALSAVAGTLVVAGLAFRTGSAGGALVYQHGAANAYVTPGAAPEDTSASIEADEK